MKFIHRWGIVLMLLNGPLLAVSASDLSYNAMAFAGFGFLCGAFCFCSPSNKGQTE